MSTPGPSSTTTTTTAVIRVTIASCRRHRHDRHRQRYRRQHRHRHRHRRHHHLKQENGYTRFVQDTRFVEDEDDGDEEASQVFVLVNVHIEKVRCGTRPPR